MRGWDVVANITVDVQGEDSMMFQIPGTNIVEHQSKSSEIKSYKVCVTGIPDKEVDELESYLQNTDLEYDAVVTGAIRSDYQKTRIERMCERLGKISFTPIWHNDSLSHLESLCNEGFKVIISSVSCEGLTKEWIGKEINTDNLLHLKDLSKKYGFNVDGEGGEYETIVIDAPHFKNEIHYEGKIHWDGVRGHILFETFSTLD